jgi:hypothetical protein
MRPKLHYITLTPPFFLSISLFLMPQAATGTVNVKRNGPEKDDRNKGD